MPFTLFLSLFQIQEFFSPPKRREKNKSGQHFLLDLTWPTSFSTHNSKMCKLRPSLSPSCGGNGRWQRRLITIAHVFFNLVFSAAKYPSFVETTSVASTPEPCLSQRLGPSLSSRSVRQRVTMKITSHLSVTAHRFSSFRRYLLRSAKRLGGRNASAS